MSVAFRRLIGCLLVGVFASAQLAVAAYACSGLADMPPHTASETSMVADHARGAAADHDADPMLSNLCVADCQTEQGIDHTPLPTLPAVLLTSLYALPSLDGNNAAAKPLATANGPPEAAEPPHTILHCCFRI